MDKDTRMKQPPFTESQVASFNEFQKSEIFHPFTCGSTGVHESHVNLVATETCLYCPKCNYTQYWAWDIMLDYSWKDMLEVMPQFKSSVPDRPVNSD